MADKENAINKLNFYHSFVRGVKGLDFTEVVLRIQYPLKCLKWFPYLTKFQWRNYWGLTLGEPKGTLA